MPLPLHSDSGNGIPAPFPAMSHVANVNLPGAKQPYGWRHEGPGYGKLAFMPPGRLISGDRHRA